MSALIYNGVEGHVVRTPLIRLRRLSELTGCEILGKAEFMNPGGSVKDRAALGIITDAEKSGRLRRGDTIVEGTAGNTGIGLTVIGNAKGYRTVIVIPETQSQEKITLLRTLGAEVLTVSEKPYSDPGNYNRVAQRLSEEKVWFWANQFDNIANRLAHYLVVRAGSKVVGYGGLWMMVDEAHITTFAVLPEWRRQGIGARVMLAMMELATELRARVATLEVRLSNDAARQLYAGFGFRPVGIRPRYYSDNGEDALIMTSAPLGSAETRNRLAALARRYEESEPG